MEQNTSIFSRGLSGMPASLFSHERLSREGRGSTALHSLWGQGQSGHWGAASTKAMDVLMTNTPSILLPKHSAMGFAGAPGSSCPHFVPLDSAAHGQGGQICTKPRTSTWSGCSRTVPQKHPWELQRWCPQLSSQPLLMRG